MPDTQSQIREVAEGYFGMALTDELLAELQICEVAGGAWLFRQGDEGSSLYLMVRGRLHVLDETDKTGATRLLSEVVTGGSVGEVALLSGQKRSAGVRAIRDSLLIKIERVIFERLSAKHPSLIMKLAANVARFLQVSSAESSAAAKTLNTITLLPLRQSKRTTDFCEEITKGLQQYGATLLLSIDNLIEQGAPKPADRDKADIPEELQHWLHLQETNHRFIVYNCESDDNVWTRFAMRQSDLTLFIADSQDPFQIPDWEARLRDGKGIATGKQALVLLQPGSDTEIVGTANWLQDRDPDFHLHIRKNKADDIQRVARIISGNALGLVLGGGGARGFAHLGVYKALLELGITVDWVGGSSIGSIFGSPVASNWDYEKAHALARHSFVKIKPFSDYTLPIVALIRGKRMEREIQRHQNYAIEDMPIPFFCVSSVLDSGELKLHEKGLLSSALRASASLPGVLPPTVIDRRLIIDGAVLNSLPVDIMMKKPIGKIIAVDLSSYKSYEVDYPAIPSPWAILAGRLLPFFRNYRVPSLATTILKATEIGTQNQVRESGKNADLLLRPPVRKFGLTAVKSFDDIVDAGYQYAKKELQIWQQSQNAEHQKIE